MNGQKVIPLRLEKENTIVGEGAKMKKVFSLVRKVADADSTILITGETGTGKGLIARAIHSYSSRKGKPFLSINCGCIPENLLESELFGHVKGAFTGAFKDKIGKFELAEGGTIFLDEIGDMSQDLQVKLLKVLEEGEFEPVGANKTLMADVRIIAATHRDLEDEIIKGNFREDLFYRLFVIPINLPPLRHRLSDLPILVEHFIRLSNRKNKRLVAGVEDEVLKVMARYDWPGNVRELKNCIERMVVLKGEGGLCLEDLPNKITKNNNSRVGKVVITDKGINLFKAVKEFERDNILQALEQTDWVVNRAAKLLHINRTTLVEKIKRFQLEPSNV